MTKGRLLVDGRTKLIYECAEKTEYCIVHYKDDASAFKGLKKGTITDKGVINNRITNHLMKMLTDRGIPTHYVDELSDRETLVYKVNIIPLEIVVRNFASGSLLKRLGLPEGEKLESAVLEFRYKSNELKDPMVNEYHIEAMNLATKDELHVVSMYALRINELLIRYLKKVNVELIDFRLEFGKMPDGSIVLADEISPDTCRFWDTQTHEKLDKDRFRYDLGHVEDAYQEIYRRIMEAK